MDFSLDIKPIIALQATQKMVKKLISRIMPAASRKVFILRKLFIINML
jgi:hypothetical protein